MAGYLGSRPVIVQVDGYQREESESRYVNVSGDDFSGHLDFVDDAKARFGSSDELHIYTESSGSGHSYIQGDNIVIRSAAGTARLTVTSNDVDVSSGALKIGGTTVIDSSRAITADGLTVDNDGSSALLSIVAGIAGSVSGDPKLQFVGSTSASGVDGYGNIHLDVPSGGKSDMYFQTAASGGSSGQANRMKIDGNGDISFYEDTGTTPKFFWDASAESLGIGTSSPSYPLHVKSSATTTAVFDAGSDGYDVQLRMEQNGTFVGAVGYDDSLDAVYLNRYGNATQGLTVVSSGFVGIGTSSPSALLHLSGSDPEIRLSDTTNANYSSIVNVDGNMIYKADAGNQFGNSRHRWEIDGSERMRLDASGRLLAGKIASGLGNTGHEFGADGYLYHTRAGDVMWLNRTAGSSGTLLTFMENGGTVGRIQSRSTDYLNVQIGSLGTGITGTSSHTILPSVNNARSDNTNDLGDDDYRWKDLYLSGGVYLGGVGGANKLDDYEEGTFSPVMVGSTSGTFTSLNLGRYTKIGRSVSIQLTFNNITYNAVVGNLKITNLPFATNLTDTVDLYVPVQVYRLNWPSDAKDIYAFQNSSNSTQLELYYSRDNNTSAQLLGTHLAGTYFRMTWSYNTA